jgi:hypothetical protein
MSIINGPYRDPEESHRPRRRKAPKAFVRLRRQFTYERQLEVFRRTFQREPANDGELEAFADEYIREMYNSGADELPP